MTYAQKCLDDGGPSHSHVFGIRIFKSVDLKRVRCLEAQMLRSHEFQFPAIFQIFIFKILEKEAPPPKP